MSIRRIKRVALNGARKDTRKTRKAKLNYELSPERDKAIEAEKEKELMAERFFTWQTDFINRAKSPKGKTSEEVIDSLNDLCGLVEQTIKSSPELVLSTLDIIYQKIQTWDSCKELQEIKKIVDATFVNVVGECVCHKLLKGEKIPFQAWFKKDFHITCYNCGYKLPASECKVVKGKK